MMFSVLVAGAMSLAQPAMEPCFIQGSAKAVECVTLQVPVDYQQQTSTHVDLEVIRYPAESKSDKAPLVVMAGGPGQAATEMTFMLNTAFKKAKQQHDILFIAQRGSGGSNAQPCAEHKPIDNEAVLKAFAECRDKLAEVMPQLSTHVLIQDVEFVRQHLGYPKLNLWGGSYGAFAAQHYASQYPDRVNGMILDAAVALDANPLVDGGFYAQQALERFDATCQSDALCQQRFPEWRKQLDILLERADRGEIAITFNGGDYWLTRTDLAHIVRTVLYVPRMANKLPYAVEQAYLGNSKVLSTLNQFVAGSATDSMYIGLTLGVLCKEHVYQGQAQRAAEAGRDSFTGDSYYQFWLQACGQEAERQADYIQVPEQLDIPTLVISGSLDPVTPEQSAEKALRYLAQAQHIVIPNAGHTNSGLGCMPTLLNEFLLSHQVADASCITNNKFPLFMQ